MSQDRLSVADRGTEVKPFPQNGIFGLKNRIDKLSGIERVIADRILTVTNEWAEINPPLTMHPWIESVMGRVEDVEMQSTVRVISWQMGRGARFNEVRARRPNSGVTGKSDQDKIIADIIEEERPRDVFGNPLEGTPEDPWGRVEGRYCISAANVAKNSPGHSLVIFNEFNPFKFSKEEAIDYLMTADKVWQAWYRYDRRLVYPFLFWNCLNKAAASQTHGHMQLEMLPDLHVMGVEMLRKSAIAYKQSTGSNFWMDYPYLHDVLDLMIRRNGNAIMAHVAPIKENEILMFGERFDEEFAEEVFDLLDVYINRLGVRSFTLAIARPPIVETDEDWSEFPGVLLRLVGRGDPTSKVADWGGLELYGGESVVSADPYNLKRLLAEHRGEITKTPVVV